MPERCREKKPYSRKAGTILTLGKEIKSPSKIAGRGLVGEAERGRNAV